MWRYASGGLGPPIPIGLDWSGCANYLQHGLGYRPVRRGRRSLAAALQALKSCEAGALAGFDEARKRRRAMT